MQRFASLDAVYHSDIARLEALEEGGFILSALSGQDCAVCGAPPGAQRHNHAADEIERSHAAAAAEAHKIEREQRDLARTIASLTAESNGLRSAIGELDRSLVAIEQKIADARPKEAAVRNDYEVFFSKKSDLEMITSLLARRDSLVVKKSQVEEKPPTPKPEDKMPVGIDGPTAYAFGKTVREILEIWRFPRAAEALFDLATSDVTIGGKERGDSGKGVKAILHAAVNVALLIYCRERSLPHPGLVVLDTPCSPIANRRGADTANCPPTKSRSSGRVWRRTSTTTPQAWKTSGNSSSSKTPIRRPTSPRRCRSRRSRRIRVPAATDTRRQDARAVV